jgi:hypothetical protein
VAHPAPRDRRPGHRALIGSAILGLLLCACPTPGPGIPVRPLGGVQIRCEPTDALVYVDDQYRGSVAALGARPLMLPEGVHRIEIRRDGYFPHFAEVTTAKAVQQRLEVKLRKEPY